MRFFFSTAVIIMAFAVLVGCAHKGGLPIAQAEELRTPAYDQQARNQNAAQANRQLYKGIYDIRTVSEVRIQDSGQISWQEKGVSLFAAMVQTDQKGAASEIGAITVSKGDHRYPIQVDQRHTAISAVSLSADQQYLAIHLKHSNGHRLVIVNMKTGGYYPLNDYLSRNGRGTVDTIHAYQWAPGGNQLALAYGDNTRSSVALYQTDQKMLLDIPTSVVYEDTLVVVWHKNGKEFDFVSAGEENVYVLHRYTRSKNQVRKVKEIGGQEVAILQAINPTYAK
ncbi:hypothetical protein [Paenibacillus sp. YPG26]|uniref:hypothetical protein n=1 Tax=Paenibacillus sp. YPG26 TaxID=2878915 RepID=UPI00203CBA16|nr:hypothetical protein [Paenibacillus sp. YPG26]USB31845.1 hypothetical protein LDO05_10830 [Paenibacillus sp. YPG26]